MIHEVEVAVIGGGAAGIAALRTLADAGINALLLEADARLGGRVRTEHVAGMAVDLGAGWLHSAEHNPWVAIAEASGFAVDRSAARWREQWRNLGFPEADQAEAGAAFAALSEAMHAAPPPSDRVSDLLPADPKWHPYLDALSGFINGAPTHQMSAADWSAYDEAATDTNWRIPAGYGALVASHAAGLPVALATPVTAIDRSGTRLRIDTPRGTIIAAQAIVTVSTNVLASGGIALPGHDDVLHAASQLPLGLADKLFLSLEGGEDISDNAHMLGNPHSAVTGTYTLRPFGRPVIECMLGGEGAREMAERGLEGAGAFAIDELCALMGSEWRGRLKLIAGSCWARETHVLGSYSHALPGQAAARQALATPIDERIHFAGEACSPDEFSTAHGAYKTGVVAAQALL